MGGRCHAVVRVASRSTAAAAASHHSSGRRRAPSPARPPCVVGRRRSSRHSRLQGGPRYRVSHRSRSTFFAMISDRLSSRILVLLYPDTYAHSRKQNRIAQATGASDMLSCASSFSWTTFLHRIIPHNVRKFVYKKLYWTLLEINVKEQSH